MPTTARDDAPEPGGVRHGRVAPIRALVAALVVIAATACGEPQPLRLAVSPDEPAPRMGTRVVRLLRAEADLEVVLASGAGSHPPLESLRRGAAELAIVDNSVPLGDHVSAVAPLYLGVLHVLYRREEPATSLRAVLTGARVYAGPEGDAARRLLRWVTRQQRIDPEAFQLIEHPYDGVDVFFTVGGVLSDTSLMGLRGYRLFSFGEAHGGAVDALLLTHPSLRAFVLPGGLYPELAAGPVRTLALPALLVARNDVEEDRIYDVARVVSEHNTELREISPLADRRFVDPEALEAQRLPLHGGTRRYLSRTEPSFVERYAEVIGLNLSGLIALVTGGVALRRSRAQHRKDRLDGYYALVLGVRDELPSARGDAEIAALQTRLRDVQSEAYELLIREKVNADDAFVILQGLIADVGRALDARRGEA